MPPWDFKKQPNKFGYQNNPRWENTDGCGSDDRDSDASGHIPCGHWHVGSDIEISSAGMPFYMWRSCPMGATIVGSKVLFATTDSMSAGYDKLFIISYDMNTGIYEVVYTYMGNYRWVEPAIGFKTVGTTTVLMLAEVEADEVPYSTFHFFVFEGDQYSNHFTWSTAAINNWKFERFYWNYGVFDSDSLRVISASSLQFYFSTEYYDEVTDTFPYESHFVSTTDAGVNWSVTTFGNTLYLSGALLEYSGNLYILATQQASPNQTDLYKSTDNGLTWSGPTAISSPSGIYGYKSPIIEFGGAFYYMGKNIVTVAWPGSDYEIPTIRKTANEGFNSTEVYEFGLMDAVGENITAISSSFVVTDSYIYLATVLSTYNTVWHYELRILRSADGINWTVLGSTKVGENDVASISSSIGLVTFAESNGVLVGSNYYLEKNITEGRVMAFFTYDESNGLVVRATPFYSHLNSPEVFPETEFQAGSTELIAMQQPIWPLEKQPTKDNGGNKGFWRKT